MRWKTLAVMLPALLVAGAPLWSADLARVRSMAEEGRTREALDDLAQHLEENPVDPQAMFLRALLLAETKKESEARTVFEEVTELRPDRPEPLNNLAVLQAALGDYDAAVETLKEALRTHPAYRTAYENLTKIYGQLASEAYSRALSVDGAHDRSSLELVLLSEMLLPQPVEPTPAATPSEPLPSVVAETAPEVAPEGAMMEPLPASGDEVAPPIAIDADEVVAQAAMETPETPSEAIEAVLSEASESDDATQAVPPGEDESMMDSTAPEPAELALLVEAWAKAWSEQRVDDYLYFYSDTFEPAEEMSLDDWRSLRRERLAAPEYVKVSVAFLDFDAGQSDRAAVRFNQSYESNTFSDVVTKTLELVRVGDSWKIVKESVDS